LLIIVSEPFQSRIPEVAYSNLLSRVFLKRYYEDQWVIPAPIPVWMDRLLRFYERRCMEVDLAPVPLDRPVFIISLPRSGSSMLQDLMCANEAFAYTTNFMDICRNSSVCAAESLRKKFGFNIRGERFLKDSVLVDGGSPADPVATWLDVFGVDPFRIPPRSEAPAAPSPEVADDARRRVKAAIWTFGRPWRRFFCKTPMLLPHATELQGIFPDAKFIHLVRDPRAVANSMVKIHRLCAEQLEAICARGRRKRPEGEFVPYPRLPRLAEYLDRFGPEDVRTTANLWNDAIDSVDAARAGSGAFHEVRYEDILTEPERCLRELFAFCEVDYPPEGNASFRELVGRIGKTHHRNAYAGFSTIEAICAERMARYGYR